MVYPLLQLLLYKGVQNTSKKWLHINIKTQKFTKYKTGKIRKEIQQAKSIKSDLELDIELVAFHWVMSCPNSKKYSHFFFSVTIKSESMRVLL